MIFSSAAKSLSTVSSSVPDPNRVEIVSSLSKPIRNFVIKGGSVKGVAYIGLRAALEACGFDFTKLERIGGTSAGAIIALAFALNLSIDELKLYLLDTPFQSFLDDERSRVPRDKLFSFKEEKNSVLKASKGTSVASRALPELSSNLGLYPGDFIRDWLEALIFHKTKVRDCTFKELHELRQQKGFKDLYVVGYNLNTQLAKTFSFEDTPDVVISDAIRISTAIPLLFHPHKIYRKINGQRVPGEDGDYWIDGGIVENYPIRLFDWGRYGTAQLGPNDFYHNEETLGFYLSEPSKKEFLEGRANAPRQEITGIVDYTKAIIRGFLAREYTEHVRGPDRARTIYINDQGIDILNFNLDVKQKQQLVQSGWDAVCRYYKRPMFLPKELCFDVEETVPQANSKNSMLKS